jgi:hypothetical protein
VQQLQQDKDVLEQHKHVLEQQNASLEELLHSQAQRATEQALAQEALTQQARQLGGSMLMLEEELGQLKRSNESLKTSHAELINVETSTPFNIRTSAPCNAARGEVARGEDGASRRERLEDERREIEQRQKLLELLQLVLLNRHKKRLLQQHCSLWSWRRGLLLQRHVRLYPYLSFLSASHTHTHTHTHTHLSFH